MPTPKIPNSERRRCVKACRNCHLRKERCDGAQPCRRCTARGVASACVYTIIAATGRPIQSIGGNPSLHVQHPQSTLDARHRPRSRPPRSQNSKLQPVLGVAAGEMRSPSFNIPPPTSSSLSHARIERDFDFPRDSTNSAYLKCIRYLVGKSLGSCRLVDVTHQTEIVGVSGPLLPQVHKPPQKPSNTQTEMLFDWCMRATSQMLCAADYDGIRQSVFQWLRTDTEATSLHDAANYLILALGAQSCPEEKDDQAESYFHYGQYLTVASSLNTQSTLSIQCYIWITLYQLSACRLEAAANAIGTAARAAYTLGLHQAEHVNADDDEEPVLRDRLWKTLRKLDLFIGTTYGRPISTYETRDTNAVEGYSPVLALGSIYETVQVDGYLRGKLSHSFVSDIAKQHRLWASRFPDGLYGDGIAFTDHCKGIESLAFAYVKASFHWSIMLLTRPFFLKHVSASICRDVVEPHSESQISWDDSETDAVLVQACVVSSIQIIDLFQEVLSSGQIPKRLPFAVSVVYAAALTLGAAVFADLDQNFPLRQKLQISQDLLGYFQNHDAYARSYKAIIYDLQEAHDSYVARRNRRLLESQKELVCRFFGGIPISHTSLALQKHNHGLETESDSSLNFSIDPLSNCPVEDHMQLPTADWQQPVSSQNDSEDASEWALFASHGPLAYDVQSLFDLSMPDLLDNYVLGVSANTK